MAEKHDDELGGAVHHPEHYNKHASGVECIDVVEHMSFNVGNAMKYLWRCGEKSSDKGGGTVRDLKKALWYVGREIQKLEKEAKEAKI